MKAFTIGDPQIADLLNNGAVGVLPTDTIYGIVALATHEAAVPRLYKIKHRDHKPGTIVASNIDQLVELGIPRRYLTAVGQYWPGPVSVVVPCDASLDYLHLGKFSLACRIPDSPELQKLLEKTGPLLTSSANHPGDPPAHTVKAAEAYFKDEVDFYVDGGNYANHQPSTIIRVVDDAVEVLRQGAVTISAD